MENTQVPIMTTPFNLDNTISYQCSLYSSQYDKSFVSDSENEVNGFDEGFLVATLGICTKLQEIIPLEKIEKNELTLEESNKLILALSSKLKQFKEQPTLIVGV